jgi:hypothetical protein
MLMPVTVINRFDRHCSSIFTPELSDTDDLPQHSIGGFAMRIITLAKPNVVINNVSLR